MDKSKTLKNAIGSPEINATYKFVGGDMYAPERPRKMVEIRCGGERTEMVCYPRLTLSTAARGVDAPEFPMSADVTADDAICSATEWANNNGYSAQVKVDGRGVRKLWLTHIATAAEVAMLDEVRAAKLAGAESGYLRFGNLPECGRSRNHANGEFEAGVSVYPAIFFDDGSYELSNGYPTLLVGYISFRALDIPAYRVWGENVGAGSDGEPLLKVSKIEKLTR